MSTTILTVAGVPSLVRFEGRYHDGVVVHRGNTYAVRPNRDEDEVLVAGDRVSFIPRETEGKRWATNPVYIP